MGAWLKIYLIVTGLGSAICVLAPGVVAVAIFFIIPGIVLSVMSTAFVWGLVFAAAWFLVHPLLGDILAVCFAFPVTAAVLWFAPLPNRLETAARIAAATRPDIYPAASIGMGATFGST